MPASNVERARAWLDRGALPGRLTTPLNRKLRSLPEAPRRLVGESFVGLIVDVVYGLGVREYRGRVETVAALTSGTGGFALIVRQGSDYLPVVIPLASVDRLTQVDEPTRRAVLDALLPA